jgi:DNA-directed RNA polymerase subunit RPC12/RpoP
MNGGGGVNIEKEIRRIKLLISFGYILSGIILLTFSLAIYYYNIPFTGSGWSIENHKYWQIFAFAWIFSVILMSIGILSLKRPKAMKIGIPTFSTIQKMKLKCKKCGNIFEILAPKFNKEYKCPKCGEIGTIKS